MILVILAICLVATIVGFIVDYKSFDFDDVGMFFGIIGTICCIICLAVTIILGCRVINLAVIDDKIAMYQEENQKIEMQIAETVEKYQNYESDIFKEVSPESSITLVSLYPELKSDTLVQKQITIYIDNNDKIKNLKETQINGKVYRWWLYFGDEDGENNA